MLMTIRAIRMLVEGSRVVEYAIEYHVGNVMVANIVDGCSLKCHISNAIVTNPI